MEPAEQIRAIREMEKSEGWGVFARFGEATYKYYITSLSANRSLSQEDVEYQRGIVYAIQLLLNAPERIVQEIESAAALAASKTSEKDEKDEW